MLRMIVSTVEVLSLLVGPHSTYLVNKHLARGGTELRPAAQELAEIEMVPIAKSRLFQKSRSRAATGLGSLI